MGAGNVTNVVVGCSTITRTLGAAVDAAALVQTLPSGKDVFGPGTPAHRLPQVVSIPAYLVLLLGCGWSAWRMRGRTVIFQTALSVVCQASGFEMSDLAAVRVRFRALTDAEIEQIAQKIVSAVAKATGGTLRS